jgi:hypothetical protein
MMELEIKLVKDPEHGTRDTGHGKGVTPGQGHRTPNSGLRTSDQDEYDRDLTVRVEAGRWIMERGDFRAEWDPQCRRGWVRQSANPYAIDGVLRILHSLILAREGGFLVHAASAVRNGRAFVFAGASGAGKTTLMRLAPPDVTLLTDEISYVRQVSGVRCQVSGDGSQALGAGSQESGASGAGPGLQILDSKSPAPKPEVRGSESKSPITNHRSQIADRKSKIENFPSPSPLTPDTWYLTPAFSAFGTPFAGELARIGQKVQAPLATIFLLKQGQENKIEPMSDPEAVRELLRHVLFFARDEELVETIFDTICNLVRHVPVRRLVFTPDARVWELIGIAD